MSKLTKPRVMRLEFRPTRISRVALPPPLLDLNPSRSPFEFRVVEAEVGVGEGIGDLVGVGDGVLVFVGVMVADTSAVIVAMGVNVSVGVGETEVIVAALFEPQ